MSKKIVAFGASSSKHSINRKLANFAALQVEDSEVNLLDLNDFDMAIFSVDREKESGIPVLAYTFKEHLKMSDGIIISFAEHNGAYSAAFKNIFDWISRIDNNVWMNKPMLLLSTSPGGRGGKTVLDIAVHKFKIMNQNTITSFCLPFFNKNYLEESGITDGVLQSEFKEQLRLFSEAL